MSEQRNKKYALGGTVIVAIIILLILVFGTLRSVIPPKRENKVELNFFAQKGLFEPARLALGVEGVRTDAPAPEIPAASAPLSPPPTQASHNDDVITQSREETIAIAREQEKKRQEEATRRANALASGAFTSPAGTGGGHATAAVQGGSSQGSPGGLATGILGGSSLLKGRFGGSPAPRYTVNESGTVVVNILVDAAGRVTRAEVALAGTTTNSPELRRAAVEAALRANFSPQQGARMETGTITYIFNLN